MTSTHQKTTSIFLTFFVALMTLSFVAVNNCSAADFAGNLKSVSITDSAGANQPPTAVINYNKNGKVVDFDASSSSDSDGSIVTYKWNFGDSVVGQGSMVKHEYAGYGSFPVTLSVIDNTGGVHVVQQDMLIEPLSVSINFQPETSPVPDGFVLDAGGSFDNSKGFGWVVGPEDVIRVRDRDSSLSNGQEYDTLISVEPNALWEYEVPNGSYLVTICVGDASYPNGPQAVQAEGVAVIEDQLNYGKRWVQKQVVVDVIDGKMSITFVGSGVGAVDPIARLCWIKIQSN